MKRKSKNLGKKIMSTLLALAMLCTSAPAASLAKAESPRITESEIAHGDGFKEEASAADVLEEEASVGAVKDVNVSEKETTVGEALGAGTAEEETTGADIFEAETSAKEDLNKAAAELGEESLAENLLDISQDSTITVPSNDQNKAKMTDKDPESMWVASGSQWPCSLEFKLPEANTKMVKKIVVKFEQKGAEGRSMDVNLKYALNNLVGTKISIEGSAKTAKFTEGYVYELAEPIAMSHLYIDLSNPIPQTLWPAVAEVEIYVDQDKEEVIELENIAITQKSGVTLDASVNSGTEKAAVTDGDVNTSAALHTEKLSALGEGALPFAEISFGLEQKMRTFTLAMAQDSTNALYGYQLLGKKMGSSEYTPLTSGTIGTSSTDYLREITVNSFDETKKEVEYESVKVVFKAENDAAKDTIPKLAEFQVWANKASITEADSENIAWNKKNLHSNCGSENLSLIVDGNKSSTWSGYQYPSYVDIDLEGLYELSEIQIYAPSDGYSQYTIYVSKDGRDFSKVAKKTSKDICPAEGDRYSLQNVEGSIVRVQMEYTSWSSKVFLSEVRVLGTKKGEAVNAEFVPPANYAGTVYDTAVSDTDAIDEVKGIVSRNIGENYVDWFNFAVGPKGDYDYFTLEDAADGKITITGNNGVSMAMGLNHYLKYFCNVSITQVGNQVKMPEKTVPVKKTVKKESKVPIRYAYNYCTMSYSMPFWGEQEWRKELDWLALNGVNIVLDLTAQEEVWRQFLTELGYDHLSAKDFIAGPAYYAWAYMANLSGYGGPLHDSWFAERTQLARKNQLIMRKLGMQPILQGFSGMVPNNITEFAKGDYELGKSDIISQGQWCSFQRPDMLRTTSEAYKKYAELYYNCQRNVYGNVSKYYATDPFHEGGNTGDMSASDVSKNVMENMLSFDPDAVWIIQAWGGNPTAGLMEGLSSYKNHSLYLDLRAESRPQWKDKNEFNQSPWVYCMLNNFGGRMGLHGHLDNMVSGVVDAANNGSSLTGIGITPEGSQNNPVLYDFLFESVWCDDASKPLKEVNISKWLSNYVTRRYGAESDNAYDAMMIMLNTVYKGSLNMRGDGAPESYINSVPKTSIGAASTWGNAVIDYNMADLEKAAGLLLEDYELLKDSEGYLYDLADVLKQILSNSAQRFHREMVAALNAKNLEQFTETSDRFLALIDQVEMVLSTRKEFLLGTWVEQAKALAGNADDFTKDLYEFNAKSLVTTWGTKAQSSLMDYSNRQWAGLTNDYYKSRWQMWIDENKKALQGEPTNNLDWFAFGWEFARANTVYTTQPSGRDLKELGRGILENYNSGASSVASDASYDYPVSRMTASGVNYQDENGNRPSDVLDGDPSTLWHTKWGASTPRTDHYIILELEEETQVTGLRYLPRSSGTNGIITGYEVYVSSTGQENSYIKAAGGTWAGDSQWKLATFEEPLTAKYVKLQSIDSLSGEAGKIYSSAAEIRVTTTAKAPTLAEYVRVKPDSAELTEGDTLQLTAVVRPQEASQEVTWISSDETTALVSETGLVTALKPGTVTIQAAATDGSGKISDAQITIIKKVPTEAEQIEKERARIRELIAANTGKKQTDYTAASWSAYDSAKKAAENGLKDNVTAAQIQALRTALEKAIAGLVKNSPIIVDVKVKSITLNTSVVSLPVGKTTELKAAVLPANAKNRTVKFTSSNPKYAKVSANGVVTALKAGAGKTVRITASAQDGTGVTKTISIRIYSKPVSKVTLKTPNTAVKAGNKVKLRATVSKGACTSLTWSSSNKNYATVSTTGVVTTKKAGIGKSVKITAAAQDGTRKKAVITLKLYKSSISKITLKSSVNYVKAGKSLKIKATLKPSSNIYKSLKWTSSNTKYAKVSSKGIVKAYKAGKGKTVKITAFAQDGSNKKAVIRIKIK